VGEWILFRLEMQDQVVIGKLPEQLLQGDAEPLPVLRLPARDVQINTAVPVLISAPFADAVCRKDCPEDIQPVLLDFC
jgi:hypothetical protein